MSEIESKARDIIGQAISQTFPQNPELLDNLDGLIQLLKGTRLSADAKDRKIALNFLCEAEVDMQACEILYHKKIYSRAMFFFTAGCGKGSEGVRIRLRVYGFARNLYAQYTCITSGS